MIKVVECSLRREIIPPSLWARRPYHVNSVGLEVPRVIKREAERFAQEFVDYYCSHASPPFSSHHHGIPWSGTYLRMDLFVDPSCESVALLEVNSRFVDGWGSSLNLTRAVGNYASNADAEQIKWRFPSSWFLPANNMAYRAEFNLAMSELTLMGAGGLGGVQEMKRWEYTSCEDVVTYLYADHHHAEAEVYYYGWDRPGTQHLMWLPVYGYDLENKRLLAEFSWNWRSACFTIPRCYTDPVSWEDIPKEQVIWKFCEKNSPDSMRASTNIVYPNELGKGKFVRQCYHRHSIIAQDIVPSLEAGGNICQLILLAAEGKVVTGYTLWAPSGTRVITDAYTHGPLIWGD